MITTAEYQQRRKKLMQSLDADAVAVIPSASIHKRTQSSDFPFRQDSNFYYLSGFNEPNAVLVILNEGETILFNQARDVKKDRWNGPVLGQEAACKALGIDKSFAITNINEELPKLVKGKSIFSTRQHLHFLPDQEITPLQSFIAKFRLIKSPAEIELLRKAAQISVAAHKRGMQAVKNCENEYQLAAEYEYIFRHKGGNSKAYESIVGGGGNACILHYIRNDDKLKPGDLVLVDAAAEYQNYAADITRTYPVSGKFTSQQKDVYQIVLNAQEKAITMVKPGATWEEIQNQIVEDLVEGLLSINIISGNKEEIIKERMYQDFYMHSAGHWLGLDVHDVGAYKVDEEPRKFAAGMTLTIEPGVYFPDHSLGVRIEDDILVTATGHEVLSAGLAKTIEDVESEIA